MSLKAIETLLSQKIGVDFKIIGSTKIAKVVENRRCAANLADLKAYFQLLQTSSEELAELVEQIVVPETYFFRDRKPFDFLINYVRTEWLVKPSSAMLRVLSVPCSTGEEPYSIAIALMEAGLTTSRFHIDAIDISQQVITKAKRGIYGKNSFRGEDFVDRNRYFQQIAEGYEVSPAVRVSVNFRQGNILNFPHIKSKYDLIFCRNLLIYLEPSACTQIFKILHQLLPPDGLLFVGSAETGKTPSNLFTSIRQPSTFVYQKVKEAQPSSVKTSISTNLRNESQTSTKNIYKPINKPLSKIPIMAGTINSNINLEQAQKLADAGYIESAINHCKEHLKQDSTNAKAYTLLGTLYQTKANYVEAEECFRKALYLNPNDYETLMHLALLKEHRGDLVGASIIQQRIQKLKLT
ncbi:MULTISPECIES: CheR family methyltransferase [unclassified Tolypothrix]|uniref:CheR family methyltransferase n=1 Tax=unclassified Tolypothrix TaxID=2649714 RepID=UPI0005EAC029|nr:MULTISPECIES: CheR family methyltransferase [unclassified Tolypothrix]EKF00018.1 CheR methyltransferase [Tolypothrix sp. PCC 7601]MBE9080848.1 tetratricopeptide repeat protein [Tolypothrix sp. LEGE 11397]UYD25286.1 tetratricopeptide repeat protein [Tolypothrix sp. PCC 7712]UYD32474.1 tetratricopeptide repeat protein [Tolypothrix sp. PCC 7601]